MKEIIAKLGKKHFPYKPNVNGPVVWDENESERNRFIKDLELLTSGKENDIHFSEPDWRSDAGPR